VAALAMQREGTAGSNRATKAQIQKGILGAGGACGVEGSCFANPWVHLLMTPSARDATRLDANTKRAGNCFFMYTTPFAEEFGVPLERHRKLARAMNHHHGSIN